MITVGWLLSAAGAQAEPQKPIKVVTSIRPLALIVGDIAPEGVQVKVLVPANADPHSFQLTSSAMAAVVAADLVVWLGADFEHFLEKALMQAERAQQLELMALPGLTWPVMDNEEAHHHQDEHNHALGRDPHIWLSPDNAALIAKAVAEQLKALIPDGQADIDARLQRWLITQAEITAQNAHALAPYQSRGFAVSHDAYGHFAQAYGLQQTGAVARVPNERLSAKKMAQLQQQVKGSACLVGEVETPQLTRLAQALKLPFVVADPLATDTQIASYAELQQRLTQAFLTCLQMP